MGRSVRWCQHGSGLPKLLPGRRSALGRSRISLPAMGGAADALGQRESWQEMPPQAPRDSLQSLARTLAAARAGRLCQRTCVGDLHYHAFPRQRGSANMAQHGSTWLNMAQASRLKGSPPSSPRIVLPPWRPVTWKSGRMILGSSRPAFSEGVCAFELLPSLQVDCRAAPGIRVPQRAAFEALGILPS